MNDDEYPFSIAAFIPTKIELKEEENKKKELYEIYSYKRIVNLLISEPLCAECFGKHKLFSVGGKEVVNYFKSNGIYFCNKEELKKSFFGGELIRSKWKITPDTKIYLIGSKAILEMRAWRGKSKVYYLPHPSRHNPFWKNYDLDTNFTSYSSLEDIKSSLSNLSI